MNNKLIILVGISGSGKSTWVNSLVYGNFTLISLDNIRYELTGNISDQSKNKEVVSLAYERIALLLNNNENVIFDATNLVSEYRKSLLNYLKLNVNKDFDSYAKIFESNPEISKKRIHSDILNNINRSNVPDHVIDNQYYKFLKDLNEIENDGYKII